MSDPEEIKFACIGCGTFNPMGTEICAGCGHQFGGPDLTPKTRIVMPPRASENLYAPPSTPIVRRGTFQIGSFLVWIAVIAVCLGALRQHISLGILALLSFVPATLRTSIVANARRAEGRPMSLEERFASFLMTILSTYFLLISTVVAFCVTCFGTAAATNSIGPAVVLGAVGGIAWAIWCTRFLINGIQERRRRENEIRYR